MDTTTLYAIGAATTGVITACGAVLLKALRLHEMTTDDLRQVTNNIANTTNQLQTLAAELRAIAHEMRHR